MLDTSPAGGPRDDGAAAGKRFVVVGAGLAGHNAALHLRKLSEAASVTLIGDEDSLPYDRPPLTKAYLLGEAGDDALTLRHASEYGGLRIVFRPATRVTAIDRDAGFVRMANGGSEPYDALLLATGSRPRRLACPGDDEGVCYVRTRADSARLRRELTAGRAIVIIGGGFIGLEVAAAALTRGCRVTLIEAANRLLSRGMPAPLGAFVLRLHRARGVTILLGETVREIAAAPSGRRAVVVSGGAIEADVVVAGIGVTPNVELAEAAGLAVDDGIVVDRHCRTADPRIFAAGEVTAHPHGGDGPTGRLESWQVAAKQSVVAASCMAGGEDVFDDPPWLWSDQFDVNLQSIGAPSRAEEFLFRGDLAVNKWTLLGIGPSGLPVGAIAVNNGRDISMMRRALRTREKLPPAMAAGFGPAPDELR